LYIIQGINQPEGYVEGAVWP